MGRLRERRGKPLRWGISPLQGRGEKMVGGKESYAHINSFMTQEES